MRPVFALGALALTVLLASAAPKALAAEAFLCGPDSVIYVEAKDLALKKKTDPCIAAYFGLKVEAPADATPARAEAPATSHAPLKNAGSVAKAAGAKSAVKLKASAIDPPTGRVANVQQAELVTKAPPAAAPGTDYRNVRIINAAPGAPTIFVHDK